MKSLESTEIELTPGSGVLCQFFGQIGGFIHIHIYRVQFLSNITQLLAYPLIPVQFNHSHLAKNRFVSPFLKNYHV